MTVVSDNGHSEFNIDFPEKFRLHVLNYFAGSLVLDKPCYTEFLDFATCNLVDKKPLLQLLQACHTGSIAHTCWAIIVPKVHPLFCNWWAKQLRTLRSAGWDLQFHLVLLADTLPCSWECQLSLNGSRLDASWLQPFRSRVTLFDPCVRTTLVSDTFSFQVMKRVRAITFSTQGVGQLTGTDRSSWQVQLIPPFQAPFRLVVDFAAVDERAVLTHAQVLAYR